MSVINKKIINQLSEQLNDKKLEFDDYTFETNHDMTIKLTDQVILYNDGNTWNIVPLLIFLSYPIIYSKYEIENNIYDITLIVCPVTLISTILKGIFTFETYQDNIMILRENDTNDLIQIISGNNEKHQMENNKRIEIKIMTLRNSIMFAPDPKYMILNKKKELKPIINLNYYSNGLDLNNNELSYLIHPKTLVYIIQYKSYTDEENKITIILGKDSNKSTVTGYDLKKSKIFNYLKKQHAKILNREGYTLPCLWYIAKTLYPIAKIIYVN